MWKNNYAVFERFIGRTKSFRGSFRTVFILKFIFILFLSNTIVSCGDDEILEERKGIEQITADRTILVYMIGENSLSSYAIHNLDSIKKGLEADYSTANILVYIDNKTEKGKLWKVQNSIYGVEQLLVKDYGYQNSVDPDVIQNVLKDAFTIYPASEKGMILWSHGSGWLPSPSYQIQSMQKAPIQKTIGPDNSDYIELWELRETLENIPVHFNFIAFDACFMANVEVAYELRNVSDYFIFSPSEISGWGFPYRQMASLLVQAELNLADLCSCYMQFYDGTTMAKCGTISLVKSKYLETLVDPFRELILSEAYKNSNIVEMNIQQLGRLVSKTPLSDYRDLFFDYQDTFQKLLPNKAYSVQQALRSIVMYEKHSDKFGNYLRGGEIISIENNCGLTVSIPKLIFETNLQVGYTQLQWYKDIFRTGEN